MSFSLVITLNKLRMGVVACCHLSFNPQNRLPSWVALGAFLLAMNAFPVKVKAQSEDIPRTPRPSLAIKRTDKAIDLDGRLTEGAWKLATVTDSFRQKRPTDGAMPRERTVLRLLFDDEALYVGVECFQDPSTVNRQLSRRDRDIESDWVSVGIDSRNDGMSAFVFKINAAGVLSDGTYRDDVLYTDEWDEQWDGAASQTSTGWTAEFRIPYRILRFSTKSSDGWGFQVRRHISIYQEDDEWAYFSRTVSGEVSQYGKIVGLPLIKRSKRLDLRPFLTARARWEDKRDLGFAGTAGLDAKIYLTQSLTLDLTVNPDFGQVEQDQVIPNLSNYEIEYPEKRPFFLEAIDTFKTPLLLLYTRRMGLAPPIPTLNVDGNTREVSSEAPGPTTIYGATKLTGMIGSRLTIGGFAALAAPNTTSITTVSQGLIQRTIEPLTLYTSLRLKYAITDSAYIGLSSTSVSRFENTTDYPFHNASEQDWRICPDGSRISQKKIGDDTTRCYHDAYVTGLDSLWRSGDYAATAQLLLTSVVGGPERALADGTVLRPGDVDAGGHVAIEKQGGEHWLGLLRLTAFGRHLDYNDLGYMNRQNLMQADGYIEYRTLKTWRKLMETRSRIEFVAKANLDGTSLGQSIAVNTWLKFTNFWRLSAEVNLANNYFDDRELGNGGALQRSGHIAMQLALAREARPGRVLYGELWIDARLLRNGYYFQTENNIGIRAFRFLDIDLLIQGILAYGEPRLATFSNEEPIFGRLDARSVGSTVRITAAFRPALTLQLFSQLLLLSRHYSDFSAPNAAQRLIQLDELKSIEMRPDVNPDTLQALFSLSVVFRWEIVPGSTLYLVYTRSQQPQPTIPALGEIADLSLNSLANQGGRNVVLVKFSYLWK